MAAEKTNEQITLMDELKNATAGFIAMAKDTITKVAPKVWRAVKMKVIADAISSFILAVVPIGIILWMFNKEIITNPAWVIFPSFISMFVLASCIRRVLASDYMTLIEIMKLAEKKGIK